MLYPAAAFMIILRFVAESERDDWSRAITITLFVALTFSTLQSSRLRANVTN